MQSVEKGAENLSRTIKTRQKESSFEHVPKTANRRRMELDFCAARDIVGVPGNAFTG